MGLLLWRSLRRRQATRRLPPGAKPVASWFVSCCLSRQIYSVGQGHVCGRNVFSLVHLHDLRQNRSKKIFKIALEAIKGQLQSAITVRPDKFVFSCNNTVLLWIFHFCLYFEMYQREQNLTCKL